MAKQSFEAEHPEFVSEVAGLSVEELDNRLASLSKANEENNDARDDDEELQGARELSRELGAPYNDLKKVIKLKSRYIIALIREKGGK